MQAYDYNNLYNKAKLYAQRAFEEERESDLFPFWLSLSLELLARSTLAKVNPVLLADISSNDSSYLFYALGYQTTTKPKSIPTNEVLQRLTKIGIEFSQTEVKLALTIVDQRNTELHSGVKGFTEYPVSIWLSDFFRICKILLKSQGLILSDFFNQNEAKAAELMIKEEAANTKKLVMDRIQSYKKVFYDLTDEQQQERRKNAMVKIRSPYVKNKIVACPACHNNAILSGELISVSEAKLVDAEIKQEKRYLPSLLHCYACQIRISGYFELKTVELGGQYTLEEVLDPVDYHGIDPEEYINVDELVERRMRDIDDYGMYGDE